MPVNCVYTNNPLLFVSDNADSGVLAPAPENFTFANNLNLVTWSFDKSRRGFSMTNAGLSISANVFQSPFKSADGAPYCYVTKLNCAWAWPPLESTKKPIVIFLQPDKTKHSSSADPLAFFRRDHRWLLKDWIQLTAVDPRPWIDLGKREIFISQEGGKQEDISIPGFLVMRQFLGISRSYGRPTTGQHFRKNSDPSIHTWQLTCDDGKQGLFDDRRPILKNEAAVEESVDFSDGVHRGFYTIITKWTPLGLSFGIWEAKSLKLTDLASFHRLLEADQDKPFPHQARFSPGRSVHLTSQPLPRSKYHGYNEENLVFSIEEDETEILPIPLVHASEPRS